MVNALGIISVNENESLLKDITSHRSLAAVPFGGRYRLIDFVLSSMVNSGIHNVGVLVRNKYRSLTDHLRSGKDWDLARKHEGLFLLPPGYSYSPWGLPGELENLYYNLDYLQNSRQKYAVFSGSNIVCNIDYRQALNFHEKKQADITILYKEQNIKSDDFTQCTVLDVEPDGKVTNIKMNPAKVTGNKISLEMYIVERKLLIDLVDTCIACGGTDFVKDGLIKNLDKLKVYGYQHPGYVARIHSVQSYYKHSLDLLKPEIWQELFLKSGRIYTKVKDEAPAKYNESSQVSNVLVANGCVVAGKVENSILFRGVKVHKGAYIRNSIIMQKTEIGENAVIEDVICDKDVRVTKGKRLKGELSYPLVIKKGMVI